MKILEKTLPRTHNLYLFGDTHTGTILRHNKGVKKLIDMLANDPIGYGVHHGDLAEGITIDDKRYCSYTTATDTSTPIQQYQDAAKELMPVAKKMLVLLDGNHDWKLANRFGECIKKIVCTELAGNRNPEDIYGTYSCKLVIKDRKGKLMYKHFATHGFGSVGSGAGDPIRQEANRKVQLKRKLQNKAGDCALLSCGHTHKLIIAEPLSELYLADDGKKISQHYTKAAQAGDYIPPDLRWYVNTGCFYRLYADEEVSGYAERAGYDPTELGFAIVRVKDGVIKQIDKVVL